MTALSPLGAVRIIAITDDALADDALVAALTAMLQHAPRGQLAVQLRSATRAPRVLYRLGERLRWLCSAAGAPLLVNDRLDVAAAIGADGVHLGSHSVTTADARRWFGASTLVTRSAHSPGDVARASKEGADAVLISPIFASPGKGAGRGLAWLAEIAARHAEVPLFALGGVDMTNAAACVAAGARGLGMIRALFAAADPGVAAASLCAIVAPAPRG